MCLCEQTNYAWHYVLKILEKHEMIFKYALGGKTGCLGEGELSI